MLLKSDGIKMYVCDIANKRIIQYTLTSAYDTSTILYSRELSVSQEVIANH